MPKLSEIQGFSRVVDEGSFTAAARSLGISPSALSKQVKSLEDRLGVRLLNRTTRKVAPTEVGRAFHERARDILDQLAEAESALTRLHEEARGRLRVSAPMDFGRRELGPTLAEFARSHPGVELELELADRFVDPVGEGFDVVIRIGALADSSLVTRRLARCRRVLCAAPAYLERAGEPRRIEELADHEGIAYAYAGPGQWPVPPGHAASLPRRWPHRANNGDLMGALAVAGLGIALLPTFIVGDDLRAGRLRELLPGALPADLTVQAVYPHRQHLAAKVRSFVDHLVEHCGSGGAPRWDRGLPDPGEAA